jgi:hypothetical protein
LRYTDLTGTALMHALGTLASPYRFVDYFVGSDAPAWSVA